MKILLLLSLTLIFGAGCIGEERDEKLAVLDNSNLQAQISSDKLFEKKQECAKYVKQASDYIDKDYKEYGKFINLENGKQSLRNLFLDKVCYSQSYNSCVALITERDRVWPDGYDSELFIIVNLLTGERTNVSKTIFSNDAQDKRLEKSVEFTKAQQSLKEEYNCLY